MDWNQPPYLPPYPGAAISPRTVAGETEIGQLGLQFQM